MKKKVLSILLASAMVLSLASCSNQGAGGESSGSEETGSSEVTESSQGGGDIDVTPSEDSDEWTVDYANNTVYAYCER